MGTELTSEQFKVVADLLRSVDPVRSVVYRVLVEGLPQARACDGTNISAQSISNAVTRYRRAHQRIESAYQNRVA